jgi:hypothetical protein
MHIDEPVHGGLSPHKHCGVPVVVPCGRPHRVAEVGSHALPQTWQFVKLGSMRASPVAMPTALTHVVPQHIEPDGHDGWQLPTTAASRPPSGWIPLSMPEPMQCPTAHVSPVAHAIPQPPQLFGSTSVS